MEMFARYKYLHYYYYVMHNHIKNRQTFTHYIKGIV